MIETMSDFEAGPRVIPPRWLQHALFSIEDASNAHPGLDRVGWNTPRREAFNLRSVATAIAFIDCGPVTRLRMPRESSYTLKHCAERWGRRIGFEPYVGNGDLILAAIYCGLSIGKAHGANCAVSLRATERR
jgi:hypothetical protein